MAKKKVTESKFTSINYSRVVCGGCGAETTIEPGAIFSGLNCSCNVEAEKPKLDDTEISTPTQEELDYGQVITVIGTFKNGDVEVCSNNDLDNTFRLPKETFEANFKELPKTSNDEGSTTENGIVTLSIEDLKGLSLEDIKAKYTVDELRLLAKSLKVKGYSNMGEDKLIARLLEKVN